MAGKTYVGGTAYDITGGKTLIGGTGYNIAAGKTLGGRAYDINFKPNYDYPKSLVELMNDMTMVTNVSINNGTAGIMSWDNTSLSTGVYYMFSICNGYLCVYRLDKMDYLYDYLLKSMNTGYGYAKVSLGGSVYYSGTSTQTSTQSINGGSMVIVQFPSYPDARNEIDYLLSNATFTRLSGRNTTSSSNVTYVKNAGSDTTTHQFYLATRYRSGSYATGSGVGNASLQIWAPRPQSFALVKNITSSYPNGSSLTKTTYDNDTITLNSCFGGSIIGVDDPSVSGMIKFTIEHLTYGPHCYLTYVAEAGMTWREFVSSQYNFTEAFSIDNSTVGYDDYNPTSGGWWTYSQIGYSYNNNVWVSTYPDDEIENGHTYVSAGD